MTAEGGRCFSLEAGGFRKNPKEIYTSKPGQGSVLGEISGKSAEAIDRVARPAVLSVKKIRLSRFSRYVKNRREKIRRAAVMPAETALRINMSS